MAGISIAGLTENGLFEKAKLAKEKQENAKIKEETTLGDCKIITPKASEFFQPILVVPILQLIAYEVAKLRGCDIDKPKNLAKSVTVE